MQKWREKPGESYHVIHATHDVTRSRHEDILTYLQLQRTWRNKTSSSWETILPLEHNRVWSWTTEGWFCCKHCESKSGFYCTMLAKFCHCGYFTHIVQQLFRAFPFSLDMFCMLDVALFIGACLVFVASIECKICLLRSMAVHIRLCCGSHVRFTSPSPIPPFSHTASSTELEVGKTWERG